MLSNDVDAGDCVRDATGWSTRYRCLPSFVIGGAQKAATGSLAKWLEGHPYLRRGIGVVMGTRARSIISILSEITPP